MKILFLNVYYDRFLESHYRKNNIAQLSYLEQWESIQGAMHSDSDFYSRGMSKQGWQAHDLITNCKPLQMQWAKENDYSRGSPIWVQQIRKYQPDVVYSQALWLVNDVTYPIIRENCRLIAGQVGSQTEDFATTRYDVIFTHIFPYVDYFTDEGMKTHYLPLAFEPRVLEKIKPQERTRQITYVGGLTSGHGRRKEALKALGKHFAVEMFVNKKWGLDMFEVLMQSYLTINYSIDVELDYIGNMRMYESTGCGALLLTNNGLNMPGLFEDDEVLKYNTPEEAIEKARYYLEHKEEGEAIAARGQARTLRDHTYEQRMAEVAEMLEGML